MATSTTLSLKMPRSLSNKTSSSFVKNTAVAEKSIQPLACEGEGIEHSAEVRGPQR